MTTDVRHVPFHVKNMARCTVSTERHARGASTRFPHLDGGEDFILDARRYRQARFPDLLWTVGHLIDEGKRLERSALHWSRMTKVHRGSGSKILMSYSTGLPGVLN